MVLLVLIDFGTFVYIALKDECCKPYFPVNCSGLILDIKS